MISVNIAHQHLVMDESKKDKKSDLAKTNVCNKVIESKNSMILFGGPATGKTWTAVQGIAEHWKQAGDGTLVMFSIGHSTVSKVFEVERKKDGGKNEHRILFLMDGIGSMAEASRAVSQMKENLQVIAITNDPRLVYFIHKETGVWTFDFGKKGH